MNNTIESRPQPVRDTRSWREQPWTVIIALAALLAIRPALSIAGAFEDLAPWGQVAATVGVYLLWVVTMLARRDPNPVRTLALAGAVYGAMVILVNPILWIFLGTPSLPAPAYVFAPVAVIGFNALVGAVVGGLAAGLLKLRRP